MAAKVRWLDHPEAHDYDAAEQYLTLIMAPDAAHARRQRLENHGHLTYVYQAKDILRASGLPLLPADNKHVAADLAKINEGEKLSPALLLRLPLNGVMCALVIADGYHRVCACYHADENTDIRCVLS